MSDELVYIGMVKEINPIEAADFIVSATVTCGKGGEWRGVVRKGDFHVDSLCLVYLPDSLIPEEDSLAFMAKFDWRVKMQRLKGAASEVLITKLPTYLLHHSIGDGVTEIMGVTKYYKPISSSLQGITCGYFPQFIPKTDEPNYQSNPQLVESLRGRPYYVTEKCDGSSGTAYRYNGKFGVCSRNLELERNIDNGYWKIAMKHELDRTLPEGMALQWEICGPKIQKNPMGLSDIQGFAFSAYDIPNKRYLDYYELVGLCRLLEFPMCKVIGTGTAYEPVDLDSLGSGVYSNGKQREGVVIRSMYNHLEGAPVSFKVINLDYE